MTSFLVSPNAAKADDATSPCASLRERLRRAAAAQHRMLDHGLRYVLREKISLTRYGQLLAALYGFYVPLEVSLSRLQAAAPELPVPLVPRAQLLERDLRALGTEPARVQLCDRPPRLASVDHLAGAFYVVEGACLGGQVIAHAVTRALGIGREHGVAFFSGDGARTAARWKAVLAWLETRAAPGGQEIIDGACRTFAALGRWLSAQAVLDE